MCKNARNVILQPSTGGRRHLVGRQLLLHRRRRRGVDVIKLSLRRRRFRRIDNFL